MRLAPRSIIWHWPIYLTIMLFISCGNDDDGENPTESNDQSIYSVDLSSASEGDQYIITPYILGDTSTINGKLATSAGSYSISVSGTSLQLMKPKTWLTPSQNQYDFDHNLRTLLNRFNPNDKASRERTYQGLKTLEEQYLNLRHTKPNWSHGFLQLEKTIKATKNRPPRIPLQSSSSCPSTFYTPASDTEYSINDVNVVAQKNDEDDYCLIYIESTSASEQDSIKVQTSIQTAISTYRTIFDSQFDQSFSAYQFKPFIVVVDTDDEDYWPASLVNLSGAFLSELSITHQRPTIFIAANQNLSGDLTDAAATASFHSTIAHELFHAVFHFYRVWVQGNGSGEPDTVSIDEGLAHLMEDILGYGESNFSTFAGAFLATFIVSSYAVFDETQDVLADVNRGAAHTFFYYLVSQKGGITFSNGKPSGGDGLTFLRSIVTGSTSGVAGVEAAYGSTWKTAFSNYLEALNVNNTTFEETVHDLQTVTAVTNSLGETANYGMSFTNFGDLVTLEERLADESYTSFDPSSLTDISLDYYQAFPYLLTVGSGDSSFIVTYGEAYTNSGVSVVRVK
ncbi:hypothetical protein [Pseudobacteriovorax antillogorgiicola]|uniref:Uncharacterized protein n=1 Tax=Pseudobacteriovorax antillogorgiicola TaxID=1513793 RepID=A0A1Y6CJS2_9BACT|nr:hypothetical protein [Pseudobacteriovorax antillogorgiicola]TCS46714.1 hypothetical protein EDD56_12390 [Pseudobacteriovorax antillogorgiicola]SMF67056.1 hypothetical protein SAMN06296036_12390 [Pseudobacteriovorax antillogorgiicola]